jgi:glyceraldehyde-3-phosphate dehydrogenase (NAD(P))
MAKNIVHVIGTGTIGEPLTGLLCDFRKELGIDEVTFHKRTPLQGDKTKVTNLVKRGARLATGRDARDGFLHLGIEPSFEFEEAIDRAAVVIDCTPSGVGISNKNQFYEKFLHNTRGFIAQGSEFGFGKPYARGINDKALRTGEDRFLQIVSCNTHNLSILMHTIAFEGGRYANLEDARFVCIRRASDLSQDGDFVPAPKVDKHKDREFGTHHARDAWHLFATLGVKPRVFSSAMVVNTQYMHALWFSLTLKEDVTVEEVVRRLKSNDRVALTQKRTANTIFSFGRDYGHYGRILNPTVVVEPTLAVRGGREVVGFAYTPQDGNSLLSSVSAAAWFLDPATYEARIQCLKPYFFEEV